MPEVKEYDCRWGKCYHKTNNTRHDDVGNCCCHEGETARGVSVLFLVLGVILSGICIIVYAVIMQPIADLEKGYCTVLNSTEIVVLNNLEQKHDLYTGYWTVNFRLFKSQIINGDNAQSQNFKMSPFNGDAQEDQNQVSEALATRKIGVTYTCWAELCEDCNTIIWDEEYQAIKHDWEVHGTPIGIASGIAGLLAISICCFPYVWCELNDRNENENELNDRNENEMNEMRSVELGKMNSAPKVSEDHDDEQKTKNQGKTNEKRSETRGRSSRKTNH